MLVFVMIFALMFCALSVSVFAEDHDHDGDGTPDHTDEEHKTLGDKISDWGNSKVGKIVGYSVAGVVFAAIVVVVYLWIPKDKDKKAEKKVKKAAK